jgi:predicted signal transduction protein with EAL and GGDEF domain
VAGNGVRALRPVLGFAAFYFLTDVALNQLAIAAVRDLAIPHMGSSWRCITVSIGYATLAPANGDSQSELLRRADAALYQAKHAGRNRVEAICPATASLAASDHSGTGTTAQNRVLRILGRGEH